MKRSAWRKVGVAPARTKSQMLGLQCFAGGLGVGSWATMGKLCPGKADVTMFEIAAPETGVGSKLVRIFSGSLLSVILWLKPGLAMLDMGVGRGVMPVSQQELEPLLNV